jgi:hypothetical protein
MTRPETIRGGKQMGNEEKIYADASQPATLVDGDKSIDCPTLGDAVVVLDHLPEVRKSAALIKVGDRVFTASEIDRLTARPDPLERAAHTVTIDRAPCLIGIARFDGVRGRFVRATSDEKKAARTLSGQVMVANDASLRPA